MECYGIYIFSLTLSFWRQPFLLLNGLRVYRFVWIIKINPDFFFNAKNDEITMKKQLFQSGVGEMSNGP